MARMARVLDSDPPGGFIVRHQIDNDFYTEDHPVLLTDDGSDPGVIFAQRGAELMLFGHPGHFGPAFADILAGRIERDGGWPDAEAQADWERAGVRYLHITASPIIAWEEALEAGFLADPESTPWESYRWWFNGPPRFAHLVTHPCRMGVGSELYELLRSGIPYDPDGTYTRRVLECRPSYVCEMPGPEGAPVPVCWAAQHADHSMGMIFTPMEHRRHGYALSLAAFQTDEILSREPCAVAHIAHDNKASMAVVRRLGAMRWERPITWRRILFP